MVEDPFGDAEAVTIPTRTRRTKKSAFQKLVEREEQYLTTLEQLCDLYIRAIELNDDTPWKVAFNSDPDVVLLFTTLKNVAELTKTLSSRISTLGTTSVAGGEGDGSGSNNNGSSEVSAAAAAAVVPKLPTDEALAALGSLYESNATLFQRYLTVYTIFTRLQERLDDLTLRSQDFMLFQCDVQRHNAGTPTFEEYLGKPVLHITTYAQALTGVKAEASAAGVGARGDGAELDGALEMFTDIIDGLARAKDEIVDRRRIERLVSERFSGKPKLVEKGRRLVFEGPLDKVSRSRTHRYYFHLFNDLLTYSEQNAGGKLVPVSYTHLTLPTIYSV